MRLIKIITILFLITIFGSCAKGQPNGITTIEYENEINGYNVIVDWKPRNIRFGHIIGPAIIQFKKKDSLIFTITNNNFSIQKKLLSFETDTDSLYVKKISKSHIVLKYDEPKLNSKDGFFTTEVPFFFNDVNFDNNRELLLVEVNNGQRGLSTFKVYQFESDELQSELYNITFEQPFRSFDDATIIDYQRRQIKLYYSGGSSDTGYNTYRFK